MPRFVCAILALAWLVCPAGAQAAPSVVASIKPVHGVVAALTDGVTRPRALVTGGASPHTYSLRPSDARALAGADLAVWVGPGLERFLAGPMESLAADARVVRLAGVDGLTRLPVRRAGVFAADGGRPEKAAGAGHCDINMPLWLDPHNVLAWIGPLVDALKAVDPAHADAYEANAKAFRQRLEKLDAALAARLAPGTDVPYVLFHDAYAYFEHRYGLTPAGVVTVDPGRKPGARRLRAIRRAIRERDVRCVFREPQFAPALVETIVAGTPARVGVLDPLGADLEGGPGFYPALLRNLADGYTGCLGQ